MIAMGPDEAEKGTQCVVVLTLNYSKIVAQIRQAKMQSTFHREYASMMYYRSQWGE